MPRYFMSLIGVAFWATLFILPACANSVGDDVEAKQISQTRFDRFVAGGYDPLSVPVDWFTPTRLLKGQTSDPITVASYDTRLIPSGVLEAAAAYAQSQKSLALIVVQDGQIEFERYWHSTGRDTLFNPQSMSKTLVALLIGIAIQEETIGGVDDRIGQYLPELENDPRGDITIRDLLQMSGGLAQISQNYEVTMENPGVKQHFGTDFYGSMLELEMVDRPGTKWDYNNNETLMLTYLLQKATGQEYSQYLSQKLWAPLSLPDAKMYLDRPDGNVLTSCCVLSRPIDWIRIGMLIRDRGVFNGKRIVPQNWIDEMLEPAKTSDGYGYQIWLGKVPVSPEKPDSEDPNFKWASEAAVDEKMVVLNGYGFQRTWILPETNTVIVRAGKEWPDNWDETLIPNLISRALQVSPKKDR